MVWRLAFQTILMVLLMAISELFLSLIGSVFFNKPGLFNPLSEFAATPSLTLMFAFLARGTFISLSIWLAGRLIDRRPFSDFGFRFTPAWWKDFGFGLFLGGFLITAIFLFELAAGWVVPVGYLVTNETSLPFIPAIFVPLMLFIMVGFYEELLSRGYQLTNLAEGFSGKFIKPRIAIILASVLSSAIFGIFHAANPNATLGSTLNICFAGLFLASGYILTGELAIPIGLHISWNFFQGNIYGFPVSGAAFSLATLIQIQQSGPKWLTGGSFGPEGGFLGIASNLLGIFLISLWVKKRTGKIKLQTSISLAPSLMNTDRPSKRKNESPSSEIFMGIKHIIWDWNGTLLDDLDLCLMTINEMLIERRLNSVSRNTYLDIFGFPVREYYLKLGFDFSKEPFEDISTEFITAYEAGRSDCLLMDGAQDILDLIQKKELTQSILSASKKAYLDQAMIHYQIQDKFLLVDGLSNHHAAGKLTLARKHLKNLNFSPDTVLLIGDTLHDAEIAEELGLRCCVIPNGHHSKQRLEKSSALVIDSLKDLKEIIVSSES